MKRAGDKSGPDLDISARADGAILHLPRPPNRAAVHPRRRAATKGSYEMHRSPKARWDTRSSRAHAQGYGVARCVTGWVKNFRLNPLGSIFVSPAREFWNAQRLTAFFLRNFLRAEFSPSLVSSGTKQDEPDAHNSDRRIRHSELPANPGSVTVPNPCPTPPRAPMAASPPNCAP